MQMEGIIAKGQLVPLFFSQGTVAASQTDVQLNVGDANFDPAASGATLTTPAVDGYVMPFDGEIVAVSYSLSAAASVGSLTVGATVDGTEKADPALTVTTGTKGSGKAVRETSRFVAGSKIGAEITSSADWDGTAADLGVVVWVLVHLEGV